MHQGRDGKHTPGPMMGKTLRPCNYHTWCRNYIVLARQAYLT